MSVIIEVLVPPSDFGLGRVLPTGESTRIELEAVVPAESGTVPLFWAFGDGRDDYETLIGDHDAVESIERLDSLDDRSLYRIQWVPDFDPFLTAVTAHEATIVSGTGGPGDWRFELRFADNESLASFQATCTDLGIGAKITRMYEPGTANGGAWFGLTDAQYEALTLAVEKGYFEIPRAITLHGLATELDLSDQAASERLRRAVRRLASNTLFASDPE